MSYQVRRFLEEILNIEKNYEHLLTELNKAMDVSLGNHCYLSPVDEIIRLRGRMESYEKDNGDKL